MVKKNSRMIMCIVLLGYLVILIDNSLVFTCSNQIGASFAMTTSATTWVSNGYALTFGSLLLLGGRLGDIFSRKKIFSYGLAVFGISSLCVGLSPNSTFLIIARLVQGCGSAIIAPATLAIIMDNFHGAAQQRAIIMYGAMSGIGISLGLIVGAGITTIASWRYGFLINVPITILLIILTHFYIPDQSDQHSQIDYWGAILSFSAMILIINSINGIGPKLVSFIVGIALLVIFVYHEGRSTAPILPFKIFQSSRRVGAYLIRFIYSGAITSFWFFTPRILHSTYHFSPIMIALAFLPMTIVNYASAQWVNRLTQRFTNEQILTAGIIVATLGFASLMGVHQGSNFWLTILPASIIVGFAQGLILSPVTTLAVDGLPSSLGGIASGVINVMLQIGSVFGLAILATISAGSNPLSAYKIQITGCSLFSLLSLLVAFAIYLILTKLNAKSDSSLK